MRHMKQTYKWNKIYQNCSDTSYGCFFWLPLMFLHSVEMAEISRVRTDWPRTKHENISRTYGDLFCIVLSLWWQVCPFCIWCISIICTLCKPGQYQSTYQTGSEFAAHRGTRFNQTQTNLHIRGFTKGFNLNTLINLPSQWGKHDFNLNITLQGLYKILFNLKRLQGS